MMARAALLAILVTGSVTASPAVAAPRYPWSPATGAATIAQRFAPPPGYRRVDVRPGTFAAWLRGLPLKPAGTAVRGVALAVASIVALGRIETLYPAHDFGRDGLAMKASRSP